MNQYKETPKPIEPFITLSYNHQDFDVLLNLLATMVDHTERTIESIINRSSYKSTDYLLVNKRLLGSYQSMLKMMHDEYDKKHKQARHHSKLEESVEDGVE